MGTDARYEISMHSGIPDRLEGALSSGVTLYHRNGRRVVLYSDREMDDMEAGQPLCYEVQGIARFAWYSGEREIHYSLQKEGNQERFIFWFLNWFMPCYLNMERLFHVLHAGAVDVDGGPILFLAPPGGGKSTLVEYFARQGYWTFADDSVATYIEGGKVMAIPSHPYQWLHRTRESFADTTIDMIIHDAREIKAVYILERRENDDSDETVSIERLHGREPFAALFDRYSCPWKFQLHWRLEYISALIEHQPVYRLSYPTSRDILDTVYQYICLESTGKRPKETKNA